MNTFNKCKKRKNCEGLLTAFCLSITALVGVFACGIGLMKEQYHSARAVSYDDDYYVVTLSAYELNNYVFPHLASYFDDLAFDDAASYFVYDGDEFTDGYLYNDEVYRTGFEDSNYNIIYIVVTTDDSRIPVGTFRYYNGTDEEYVAFDEGTSLDIYFQDYTYDTIKSLIEQDIQAYNPNPSQPMLDFINIIVSGIGAFGVGVANGVKDFASALFLKVEGGVVVGLSTFGGILAIFSGLALAVAITTKVYIWITSLGN